MIRARPLTLTMILFPRDLAKRSKLAMLIVAQFLSRGTSIFSQRYRPLILEEALYSSMIHSTEPYSLQVGKLVTR